jgi:hypothetical protein
MRLTAVLALLLITACRGEPDFDERYDQASEEITAKADAIDAELQRREKKAGNANEAANESVP